MKRSKKIQSFDIVRIVPQNCRANCFSFPEIAGLLQTEGILQDQGRHNEGFPALPKWGS